MSNAPQEKQRGRISFDNALTIACKAALIAPFVYFCFGWLTDRLDYQSVIFFAAVYAFLAAYGVFNLINQAADSSRLRAQVMDVFLKGISDNTDKLRDEYHKLADNFNELGAEYKKLEANYKKLAAEYQKIRDKRG